MSPTFLSYATEVDTKIIHVDTCLREIRFNTF